MDNIEPFSNEGYQILIYAIQFIKIKDRLLLYITLLLLLLSLLLLFFYYCYYY